MALDPPKPGQVIGYRYLWWSEHRKGLAEGAEDHPCAVVYAVRHWACSLVQEPGGKQRIGRDETELVAERVCAIKASLAPGLSFDRAQNDGSCVARAFEGTFQIGHGEIHVIRIW